MLKTLIPAGRVNHKWLKRVPMYRPTDSNWLPYGMPKQRIMGKKLRPGAKHVPVTGPTKPRTYQGSTLSERWLILGKRKKTLKAKNGYCPFKPVKDKPKKAYKGKVIYHGYPEIEALFGNRAAVAYRVISDWAHDAEALNNAVSWTCEWAWKYARGTYRNRGKQLHDRILPANIGKMPPEWIEVSVLNAIKAGSRDDSPDKWEYGRAGTQCGECRGTGKEYLGDGFSVPCGWCEGSGKLTKRQHHRKMRTTTIPEGEERGGDDDEVWHSVTPLNDPKYRNFEQPIWHDYQQQLEHWHEDGRPGELADYNYTAFKTHQAAHWIDAEAIPWIELRGGQAVSRNVPWAALQRPLRGLRHRGGMSNTATEASCPGRLRRLTTMRPSGTVVTIT